MTLSLKTIVPTNFLEELLHTSSHFIERKAAFADASDAMSIGEELKNHAQKELDLQLQQYFNLGDIPSLDTFQRQPTTNTTDTDADNPQPPYSPTVTTQHLPIPLSTTKYSHPTK
jgi:hypothetical protein